MTSIDRSSATAPETTSAELIAAGPVHSMPVVLVHDQRGALWSRIDRLAATMVPSPLVIRSADLGELGRLLTEQHVDVAEAEVGVEHRDPMPLARQRHREVDDDVGLADAALAARHREADDAASDARLSQTAHAEHLSLAS